MGSPGFRDSAPPSVGVSSFPPPPPSSPVGGREGARLSSLAITSSRVRTSQSHPGPAVAAPHTQTLNQKGSRLQLEENPQKAGKVLGVALLLLENMCPISLREADNNAKPYWKIKHWLNRVGRSWDFFFFFKGGEGNSYCLSNKLLRAPQGQPAALRSSSAGSAEGGSSRPASRFTPPPPRAGQVHRGEPSRGGGVGPPATPEVQSSSSPGDSGLVLTPGRGAARRRWRLRTRAGKGGGRGR